MKKLLIIIVLVILISITLLALSIFGYPVGYKNKHILIYRSYKETDFGPRTIRSKFYLGVDDEECEKLNGHPRFEGIGTYAGCEP